jgi:CheY-like chemotaxis protein
VRQTLLLADDSITIQRVIELTFADEDINVVAVSDGDQAIARLDSMPPDIVLVDVGMPGKNGYDVAGHVKHTPHLSHIPVVLLTGAFEPVDEVRANALRCDGVLAKPFEPQIVISRVKELLARPAAEALELAPAVGLAAFAPEMKSAAPAIGAAPMSTGDAGAKLDEYFDQLESAFARLTSAAPVKPADIAPVVAEDTIPAALDWFGPAPASERTSLDPSLSLHAPPLPALSASSSGLQLPDSAELVREIRALAPPTMADRNEAVVATPEPVAASEPMTASVPVAASEPSGVPEPVGTREPAAYTQAAISEPVEQRASIAVGEPMVAVPSVPRELPALGEAFAAIIPVEQADPSASQWPSTATAAAPEIADELVARVSRRVIEQLTDRVVREAVADIAERLIREEIDRIKKSIE